MIFTQRKIINYSQSTLKQFPTKNSLRTRVSFRHEKTIIPSRYMPSLGASRSGSK